MQLSWVYSGSKYNYLKSSGRISASFIIVLHKSRISQAFADSAFPGFTDGMKRCSFGMHPVLFALQQADRFGDQCDHLDDEAKDDQDCDAGDKCILPGKCQLYAVVDDKCIDRLDEFGIDEGGTPDNAQADDQ